MDGEEECRCECRRRRAEHARADDVEQRGGRGVEEDVREVEARGGEAPEPVVGGVGERLQRAVVAARDAAREEIGREETRQRVPTLDRGIPDDQEEVVPEKGVRERVRVDDEHDGDDEHDVPRDDRGRIALPGAVAVSGVSSRHGTLVELYARDRAVRLAE